MEIVDRRPANPCFRAAMFDFDGTLSLLRRNWHEVMIPMMVEILAEHTQVENKAELTGIVETFVMRLNGRQTIYQMMQLCDEIRARGGSPLEPLAYKHRYHDLLWDNVRSRIERIESGLASPEDYIVPGAKMILERLKANDVTLYLASGTDLNYVLNELRVLGLAEFFEQRVFGAMDDYRKFSKSKVIAQAIEETGAAPEEFFGCGDGFVEIEELRKVGAYAIGVASNESSREGVNQWKRERLIRAGANAIIPDYRDIGQISDLLGLDD